MLPTSKYISSIAERAAISLSKLYGDSIRVVHAPMSVLDPTKMDCISIWCVEHKTSVDISVSELAEHPNWAALFEERRKQCSGCAAKLVEEKL